LPLKSDYGYLERRFVLLELKKVEKGGDRTKKKYVDYIESRKETR
jgi:hypothetical protein